MIKLQNADLNNLCSLFNIVRILNKKHRGKYEDMAKWEFMKILSREHPKKTMGIYGVLLSTFHLTVFHSMHVSVPKELECRWRK
jgi:hypothetical protein